MLHLTLDVSRPRMFRIFFFVVVALYTCLAALQNEYQNCVHLDQEKAFKVCWTYNESSDIINFALKVSTLGWIGFGFAHKIHRMQNYACDEGTTGLVTNLKLLIRRYI